MSQSLNLGWFVFWLIKEGRNGWACGLFDVDVVCGKQAELNTYDQYIILDD